MGIVTLGVEAQGKCDAIGRSCYVRVVSIVQDSVCTTYLVEMRLKCCIIIVYETSALHRIQIHTDLLPFVLSS